MQREGEADAAEVQPDLVAQFRVPLRVGEAAEGGPEGGGRAPEQPLPLQQGAVHVEGRGVALHSRRV